MPELKCTVQTCTHNKQFYCDLDAIEVQGDSQRSRMRRAAEVSWSEKEILTAM